MKFWLILLSMVAFVYAADRTDASNEEKKFFPFNLLPPDIPAPLPPHRPPPYQRPMQRPIPTPVYNKPTFIKPPPPKYPNTPRNPPPTPMRPINILLNLPTVPATAEKYTTTYYAAAYPVAATYPATTTTPAYPTAPSYTATTPSYPTPALPNPTLNPSYATPAPSYPIPRPSYQTPQGYPSPNVEGPPFTGAFLP